jgi:hypothetical protein
MSYGHSTLYVTMNDPQNAPVMTYELPYDTRPPDAPVEVEVTGETDGVTIRWSLPDSNFEDTEYFNVLCEVNGQPAPAASPGNADWVDTQSVCGLSLRPDGTPAPATCDGALVEGDWPQACYVCGAVSFTASELRLTGLTEATTYRFALVAVDEYGNASRLSEVVELDTATLPGRDGPTNPGCQCTTGRGPTGFPLGLLPILLAVVAFVGWRARSGRER